MYELPSAILRAKINLYALLLKLPTNEITDQDVEILFALSKDDEIQKLFEKGNNHAIR